MRPVSEGSADEGDAETGPRQKRKRSFPPPVVILTVLLVLVWIAAFFIPSGQYALDAAGSPIAGSFRFVPAPLDFGGRVRDLLLAPINGMYGIRDLETGMVGPSNRGKLFGSVEVFLFILSIGGFMSVVFATGALERGIHHLSYRFRERATLLVAILTAALLRSRVDQGLERREPWALCDHGPADDRARLRPAGHRGGHHRRAFRRRGRRDDQSVQHRDRSVQGRRLDRRSSRPALYAARVQRGRDGRLHALVRAAGEGRSGEVALRHRRRRVSARGGGQAPARAPDGHARGRDRPRGVHFRAPDLRDHSLGRNPRQRRGRPRHGDDDPVAAVVGAWVVAAGTHRPVFRHDHRGRDRRPPRSGGPRQSLPQGSGRVRRSGLSRDACAQRLGGHDEHQDDRHGASRHGGPGRRRLQRQVHPPDVRRRASPFRSSSAAGRRVRRSPRRCSRRSATSPASTGRS